MYGISGKVTVEDDLFRRFLREKQRRDRYV